MQNLPRVSCRISLSTSCRSHVSSSSTSSFSTSSVPSPPTLPAIAFDIDGVLLRGRDLLATATTAIRKVTRIEDGGTHPIGVPHVFLTNGGGVAEEAKAAQLTKLLGVRVKPESVVLSHTPMKELVTQYGDKLVLTLGMTDVRSVARSYGFKHVLIPEDLAHKYPDLVPHWHESGPRRIGHEPSITHYDNELESIAALFVLHDPVEWYRDLQIAMDLLTMPRPVGASPPAVFFSNPDFLFSGRHKHPRLAQGAFRVCLEALYKEYTGKKLPYTLYGKPHAVQYKFSEKLLQQQAARFGCIISHYIGIGDNPAADIRGANDAGWTSVMVATGSIPRSIHPNEQPQHDAACVDEAVTRILNGEI